MPDLQILEPAPSGLPFPPGIRAGNLVFVSGQVAADDEGNLIGAGDVRAQTKAVLERVRGVVAEAGGDLTNVVATTVYLTDLANFPAYNEAWSEVFGDHLPTRATVEAGLVGEYLVEVQAIAVL